jgi:hypothetical protein
MLQLFPAPVLANDLIIQLCRCSRRNQSTVAAASAVALAALLAAAAAAEAAAAALCHSYRGFKQPYPSRSRAQEDLRKPGKH